MSRTASPRLAAYAALAALGLLGALALRRPELAVLAAPFAGLLALGLQIAAEPHVRVWFSLERDRALEGDELTAELELSSTVPVERLELVLVLPDGIELAAGENPLALRLGADEERTIELRLRCARWGVHSLGEIRLRARDRLGLVVYEQALAREIPLKVYPRPETIRALLPAAETQVYQGNEVSRAKGDGLEFAEIRPYFPGDRLRSINWRASARRDGLFVNERHPERNIDVILFLDSFAEARRLHESTLDHAVRATATLASRYLERRDRVGLVSFGGILHWLLPGMGIAQRYRIVDALLETEIVFNYAWKDVSVIPVRTLPPKALVIAVTPLLDERSVKALADLRGRGYDLAIVEVSPVPFVEAGVGELDELAHRLWLLKRSELRSRYQRLGVAVAEWRGDEPLELALEEVRAFRRHARLARAH
ncbi:MAG: DUF58 domain-containing protein [Actinobacteria bacterium]|nr:DUF58 domain-containing protein [Actinomycetota bacterium]